MFVFLNALTLSLTYFIIIFINRLSFRHNNNILKLNNLFMVLQDSIGTEKSCGVVNLEYFDTCTEASTRMAKKTTNVFVIGSSDKGFFESHSVSLADTCNNIHHTWHCWLIIRLNYSCLIKLINIY